MNETTAKDAEYGTPGTASTEALAEARARRAAPGYVSGDALRRKHAELVTLPSPPREVLLRRAGIPSRDWGMQFVSVPEVVELDYIATEPRDGSHRQVSLIGRAAWKQHAHHAGGFCVVPAFVDAFEWVKAWQPCHGSLWLEGHVGRGKSLLAAAKAEELLTRAVGLEWDHDRGGYARSGGVAVLWCDEASLGRAQRAHRRHSATGTRSPMRRAAEVAVLVLDDLLRRPKQGKGYTQQDEDADLEWLINERYANSLPIIVTSNEPLAALSEARGDRIGSRVYEMCAGFSLVCGGPDWRAA